MPATTLLFLAPGPGVTMAELWRGGLQVLRRDLPLERCLVLRAPLVFSVVLSSAKIQLKSSIAELVLDSQVLFISQCDGGGACASPC